MIDIEYRNRGLVTLQALASELTSPIDPKILASRMVRTGHYSDLPDPIGTAEYDVWSLVREGYLRNGIRGKDGMGDMVFPTSKLSS